MCMYLNIFTATFYAKELWRYYTEAECLETFLAVESGGLYVTIFCILRRDIFLKWMQVSEIIYHVKDVRVTSYNLKEIQVIWEREYSRNGFLSFSGLSVCVIDWKCLKFELTFYLCKSPIYIGTGNCY